MKSYGSIQLKLHAVLIIVLMFNPAFAQDNEDVRNILNNISNRYNPHIGYQMNIGYSYYVQDKAPLTFRGFYFQQGGFSYFKYEQSELLKEGTKKLLVHHDQKVIIYNESSDNKQNETLNLDSLLTIMINSKVLSINLQNREIALQNPENKISRMTIFYEEDFRIRKINIKLNDPDTKQNAEFVLTYSNQKFGPSSYPSKFDYFLNFNKGKPELNEKFRQFQFYSAFF